MSRPRPPVAQGAKEQLARLLALVPYLSARDEVHLDEAAAVFGVTPQQLVRDLKVLFLCGLPGGYPDDLIDVDIEALEDPDGDRVIRVRNADYLARPLRLTPTEATAVIVALRALRAGARDEATRSLVDSALGKLEQAAAAGSSVPPVEPGEVTAADQTTQLRDAVERALATRRQLEIVYWVPSRDEESRRVVDPHGVITRDGADYLDAYCHSAEAPRWFRVDRIREARVLDTPASTAVEGPRDLADGLFDASEELSRVTLDLAPGARWAIDYYAVEQVRERPDGHLEVEMLVADPRWLTRLLLRLAPYARVVEPHGAEGEFVDRAGETLRLYGDDTPDVVPAPE